MILKKLFGLGSGSEHPAPPAIDEASIGWTPVNALEEQMVQFPHSVDAQIAFARMILNTDVFFATATPSEDPGSRVLEEDTEFQFLSFDDRRGGSAAGLFTSTNRITETLGEGTPFVAMNGRTALQVIAHLGAIINPGPGLYAYYAPPTIERILDGDL